MRHSINHVVVLVVFQPCISKTRSHLPPAFCLPFYQIVCLSQPYEKWYLHRTLWGEVDCFLSLLHSFLSVTQFFNLLFIEGRFLLSIFPSFRNILLRIHDFTQSHTWELWNTSTVSAEQFCWSGLGCFIPYSNQLLCKKLEFCIWNQNFFFSFMPFNNPCNYMLSISNVLLKFHDNAWFSTCNLHSTFFDIRPFSSFIEAVWRLNVLPKDTLQSKQLLAQNPTLLNL